MDFLRILFHRLFDPVKIEGYIVVSANGLGLFREDGRAIGWGARFSEDGTLHQFFFHPTWTLGAVRKLTVGWRKRPATAYSAILDRSTGTVQITGGSFGFWEMATWHLPPGSPIGPAPAQRPRDYFSPGREVWYFNSNWDGWEEGIVVSVGSDWCIFVSHDGTISKCYYTQDIIWPHDPY